MSSRRPLTTTWIRVFLKKEFVLFNCFTVGAWIHLPIGCHIFWELQLRCYFQWVAFVALLLCCMSEWVFLSCIDQRKKRFGLSIAKTSCKYLKAFIVKCNNWNSKNCFSFQKRPRELLFRKQGFPACIYSHAKYQFFTSSGNLIWPKCAMWAPCLDV